MIFGKTVVTAEVLVALGAFSDHALLEEEAEKTWQKSVRGSRSKEELVRTKAALLHRSRTGSVVDGMAAVSSFVSWF